ncbi:MAG: C25 family cysteine peptidase [Acidobacteriota bacterium]
MKQQRGFLIIAGIGLCIGLIAWLNPQKTQGATFTVTNTNDSGAGSLRQAIINANATSTIDTINFAITGSGVKTIAPLTPFPDITAPVIIDGTTQTGWSVGNLVIELDGTNAGASANGLSFFNIPDTAATSIVRGLAINRFSNAGIATQISSNITIEGCHIGTDPTGTIARGNVVGILLQRTIGSFLSINITVGGNTAAERNVISGNTFMGLRVFGSSLYNITGNYIGTDKSGMVALPNVFGMEITGVNITVGGATSNLRNVISGNTATAMNVNGLENIVQGNFIGVAADGITPMGNNGAGITIIGNGSTNNDHTIGGLNAGEGNLIAYNTGDGINIFRDTNPTTGHRILGNSIFSNGGQGIDLDQNGVTPNDTGDGDTGTNNLQNFPVLASAVSNGLTTSITGQFNSAANTSYRIEFFASSSCDPSGNGEGETFLGFTNVTTNSTGNANINANLPPTSFGQFITATATRNTAPLDTSEFSACVPVIIETLVVTNTNDSGAGSLRQAIIDANANANQTLITFNIASEGVQTITLASALPSITAPIVIDGLSQQNASCSSPLIELDGTNAGAGLDGLLISAGNSTVQGLIINRFSGDGISLINNGGNTIRCNRLGTNAAGNADFGNNGNGVLVSSSSNNTISDNTISGNSLSGVRLVSSSNNLVQGNLIGLSADGLTKIGNSSGGISFFTLGTGNLIGGTTVAARNIISGNAGAGIALRDASVTNNTIQGNYIGVNVTGSGTGFGNTTDGIQIFLNSANNTIGGTNAGESNLIAFNANRGVSLQSTAGTGNKISGNAIHSNGTPTNFLGIDLNADGITANDAGDADTGANNLQNFPVISSAEVFSGLGTVINGTLNSAANTSFRIEFFTNPTCDALGNGEGQTFLGFVDVTTNASGNATISHTLPTEATIGHALTATATRNLAPFDTSEFSVCRTITAFVPPSIVVTNTNDSGAGSLRQAIIDANADPAPNTLTFNIAGAGVKTISPTTPLPTITAPVIIDGLSQPNATCSSPIVELNGTNAGAGADGLVISAGNSTVQGLIINRFNGDGIEFNTTGTNTVKCSRIGTSQSGLAALGNGANGIFLNNVSNNTIGGTADDGNLISANTANGILIDGATTSASNNTIQGNLIGVNSQGNVSAGMSNTQDGIHIQGANATNNTIGGMVSGARNVISNNGDDGIETASSASNTIIKGNFIGVNSSGNGDAGNVDRGIVANGTTTIGGTTAAERNIISANIVGIQTVGTSATTTIQGNYIGLGADGTTALGNTLGVFLNNTNNSLIGGTVAGAGNVISANPDTGITLDGSNNFVQGNLIGTDATGTLDKGNGDGNTATGGGISVADPNNTIGGSTTSARNLISGNNFGIFMGLTSSTGTTIKNNFIGTNVAGTGALGNSRAGILIASNNNIIGGNSGEGNIIAFSGQNGIGIGSVATGNRITANSIYSNNLMGIDLGNNGVVQVNDNLDPDTGANNLQNYPVITSVSAVIGVSITIQGTLNSSANAAFQLDFYANTSCDNSGFGEGRNYLGATNVTTNASGDATFNVTFNVAVASGSRVTATATDASGNTSEFSACSQPTLVELMALSATGFDNGSLIEWQTGFEADNLGFNIYRDENGKRELLNAQLVAGSALKAGAVLTAGDHYGFWVSGTSETAAYWLEDVDLNGHSTWHGPVYVKSVGGKPDEPVQARFLTDVSKPFAEIDTSKIIETVAGSINRFANTDDNLTLAKISGKTETDSPGMMESLRAIKIGVKQEGFYRLTPTELSRAGLSKDANPQTLQMFVEGKEIPISVVTDKSGSLQAVEFYGVGLDTPSTNTRIYWLVEGTQSGKRLVAQTGRGEITPQSFIETIERRDRSIYFAALRNGEKENFFGAIITAQTVDQTLTLKNLAINAAEKATLEITLQGVTQQAHRVQVQLNGNLIGYLDFNAQQNHAEKFAVPLAFLQTGVNTVRLTAQNGASDVSLVDAIRVSYPKTFTAENNQLKFTAREGERISINGFTSKNLRVFDVTATDAPQELACTIEQSKLGGLILSVATFEKGTRRLLAIANDQPGQPVSVKLNIPSDLKPASGADFVVIANGQFLDALKPLKQKREAEGLKVALVDVEDLYDEFNFGNKSPQAIRAFLSNTQSNKLQRPRFVLLVGDASYDAKNYLGRGEFDLLPTRFIDTEFMETASDDWFADFNDDGIAEMAVGRLPARTLTDAENVIAKILHYQPNVAPASALLVSDANEGFDFEGANGGIRSLIEAQLKVEELRRGQLDATTAKAKLFDALNRGQRLVNYVGHGSLNVWRGNLLTAQEARNLTNASLPMFVTMSCLNGDFSEAESESLGEALLLAGRGGALAVWASSGLTSPHGQKVLNQNFINRLFNSAAKRVTIGEAAQQAKTAIADMDIRRTWILLGDPTLRLK